MATAEEVIAAAQAATRKLRHLNGLVSEVAESPTVPGPEGSVLVELRADLFTAICERAEGNAP